MFMMDVGGLYLLFFFFSYGKEIRKEAKEKEKMKFNKD